VASAEKLEALLTYDAVLSTYNRAEFLEFLFSKATAYVASSTAAIVNGEKGSGKGAGEEESRVVGYIVVGNDNRVLGLYAESQVVAEALMDNHLKKSGAKKVGWLCRGGFSELTLNGMPPGGLLHDEE
jgi:hypothetical protein